MTAKEKKAICENLCDKLSESNMPFALAAVYNVENLDGCVGFNCANEKVFFGVVEPLFATAAKNFGKTLGTFTLDFFKFVSEGIDEERKND